MGKILDKTNNIINDIKSETTNAVNYISSFNHLYDEFDLLKNNHDVIYLKKMMKDKLLLGINCNDHVGSDTNISQSIKEILENDSE